MTCETITLDNGVTGVVCTRGRRAKRCKECGKPASKQCDFKLRGKSAGRTCDVHLCDRCAVVVGANLDYCPPHARLADHEREHRTAQQRERGRDALPVQQDLFADVARGGAA